MRRLAFAVAASLALTGIVACEDINEPDPGDPVDLSYALCTGAPDTPTWFAFQDGNGPWTRVIPAASGAFNFTIASGRGGIAMFTPNDGVYIVYASTAEMQANFPACTGPVRTVGGTATGYVTADNIKVVMGLNSETTIFGSTAAPAPFSLSPAVDANVTDLVATRYRSTSSPTSFEAFPTSVFHRRDVTGTSVAIDFGSAAAGPPVQRTLNVTNLVTGEALFVNSYLGTSTTLGPLAEYRADPALVSGSVTAPFYGIAESRLAGDERHMTFVQASRSVGSTQEHRITTAVFTNPVDRSITFGPALASVTVAGSARPSATYTVQADYDNVFEAIFEQGSGSSFRKADVVVTQDYLGGVSSVTVSVPDLSGASGFQSAWLLVPGQQAFWSFFATDADVSILNNRPITYRAGVRQAPFTP